MISLERGLSGGKRKLPNIPMNLTIEEELRLKTIIRSDEKERLSVELSGEIEKKEKVMLESISEDYLNIINKCTDLERVKQILPRIASVNEELGASIRDVTMQHMEVVREIEESEQVKSRLDLVMDELREVLRFMEMASECEDADEDARGEPLYYYRMARNVQCMGERLSFFQKYTFFTNMSRIFTRTKDKLTRLLVKDTDMWMRRMFNEVTNVGVRVHEILGGSDEDVYVFDILGGLRRCFIDTGILSVVYGSRKICVDSMIVERINSGRRSYIDGVLRQDDPRLISTITGFVLWSHFLKALDPRFKTHNRLIFDILSGNEMLFRMSNFAELKETLVSLRTLVMRLNFDFEELDSIVSRVAVSYFESQGPGDRDGERMDLEAFRSSMAGFIDESSVFVSNISQFSNELDELLAKKIDSHLCRLLEQSSKDMDMFMEAQGTVRDVLSYAVDRNSFYRNIDFRCVRDLERRNKEFVEDIVGRNKARIDELFRRITEDDDFSIKLLQLFARIKELRLPDESCEEVKRRLILHVRDKFTEELEDGAGVSPSDRKVVIGHGCSFYGYLRKNETSLCHVFDPAMELCKKGYR